MGIEALYAAKTDLTAAQVLKIASAGRAQHQETRRSMKNPELDTIIERNRILAKELGINGTPSFVVGKDLLPGAVDLDALKEGVGRTREGK